MICTTRQKKNKQTTKGKNFFHSIIFNNLFPLDAIVNKRLRQNQKNLEIFRDFLMLFFFKEFLYFVFQLI